MGDKKEIGTTYTVLKFSGPALPNGYTNFVLAKWLRNFRHTNDYMKLTFPPAYFAAYTHYINRILSHPDTEVRLAALSDDHDVCLGFSVSSKNNVLHYVYVGVDYRLQGIGKSLVPFAIEEFTHLTTAGRKIWKAKFPDVRFNPFQ